MSATATSSSSSSSLPYPDPTNNRVNFKLDAARIHLDRLIELERNSPEQSLALTIERFQVEMEIDEILYYLVGVKDALLQEINRRFDLGLELRTVDIDTINKQLKKKYGGDIAREMLSEINRMTSSREDPLWLINECHNHSKHREMLGMAKTMVIGGPTNASLIDPRTGQGVRRANGTQKPPVEYLEESYVEIEKLQKKVRDKINSYFTAVLFKQGFSQTTYLLGLSSLRQTAF